MKEIVVVSGKGGSGKTIFAASLAYLFNQEGFKVMAVDVNVDTPTMRFLLPLSKTIRRYRVYVSRKATIDGTKCNGCLRCLEICPYGAIENPKGAGILRVNTLYCEGCGVCAQFCPTSAISMIEWKTGDMVLGETEFGFPLFTAQLEIGGHNSGPLVREIRNIAAEIARDMGIDVLVVDGSPGIECTVIASIAGASYTAIVSEPTPQSFRGAFRAAKIAQAFRVLAGFIINKSMGYPVEEEAERLLSMMNARLIGKIPYDYEVIKSLTLAKPVVAHSPESSASKAIRIAYHNIKVGVGLK
jgi:MinD superfamily P-loop ATPase